MKPKSRHWYGHPGSIQMGDDIKLSITDGYQFLSWEKAEVYIQLILEETDNIIFTDPVEPTDESSITAMLCLFALAFSLLY